MIVRSSSDAHEIAGVARRMSVPSAGPRRPDALVWAEVDGAPIGTLDICYRRIRTIDSDAMCALLERLVLLPAHWGRSVALQLVERALETAEGVGARLAIGRELPVAPPAWGAAPVAAQHVLTIHAPTVLARQPGPELPHLRRAGPEDSATLNELHARANANRPGTVIREGKAAEAMPGETVLISDHGYVAFERRDDALLTEVHAVDREFHLHALRIASRTACEQGLSQLRADVPPEHPLSYVARLFGSRHAVRHRTGGWCDGRALGPHPSCASSMSPGDAARRMLGASGS